MKYIQADKLITEIERQQRRLILLSNTEQVDMRRDCALQNGVYNSILATISSLQQERPEVGLEVSKFCQPVPENIANCIAEHYWEMLDDEKKEDTRTTEPAQQEQTEVDLENYISNKLHELGADLINHKPYSFNRGLNVGETNAYHDILDKLNARKEE